MFQLIIIIILLTLICYLELFQKKEGKFISLDKSQNNYKVDQLVFTSFLKNDDIILKEHESILILFSPKNIKTEDFWYLDVYHDKEIIYTFFKPLRLQFSTSDIQNTHSLNTNTKYTIFLRSNIDIESTSYKYLHHKDMEIFEQNSKIFVPNYYNDIDLKNNFINYCYQIIKEMKTKNWYLKSFIDSKSYNSIPGNIFSNKINTILKQNQNCILVCSNKKKSLDINQHIEIHTSLNNFSWSPDNDSYISHLIIENEIDNNKIQIIERCGDSVSNSNLLPFRLIVFEKY